MFSIKRFSLFVLIGLTCCTAENFDKEKTENTVSMILSLTLNSDVYDFSDFGEPPQMAVWMENLETAEIRTLWVTYRTGKNSWVGKVNCPLSLPYWSSRRRMEKTTSSLSNQNILPDAITSATPGESFSVCTEIEKDSQWDVFLEVNVSGDFNAAFPSQLADGTPDNEFNGQPSLIFRSHVIGELGFESIPVLIGRTDQWKPVDTIVSDLSGITDSKHIFKSLKVSVNSE